jgi:hypothetical protein
MLIQDVECIDEAEDAEQDTNNFDDDPNRFSSSRGSWQNVLGRRNSPLFSLMNDHTAGDGDDAFDRSLPMVSRTLTDSRKWLLQTFTAADLAAADGHEAERSRMIVNCLRLRSKSSVDSSPSPRARRDTDSDDVEGTMTGVYSSHSSRRNTQDETASLAAILHQPEFSTLFEHAGRLDFDALTFASRAQMIHDCRPLQCLGAWRANSSFVKEMTRSNIVPEASGKKFQACFTRFLGEIDDLYNETPYHNSSHASDVVMTMEWFLKSKYLQVQVTPLEHVMIFVAAAIHDVGHPGRNNLFHTKTMSELAVTYNDKSVLENMHVAKAFQTMQSDPQLNWFAMLQPAFSEKDGGGNNITAPVNLQHFVRRGLIDMVLATDNAKHPEHVHKIVSILEASDEPPTSRQGVKMEALEKKLNLLECILHAADISNPCKPHEMMLQWTERVLEEFWAQGDEERELGLECSPLCDREAGMRNVPKGQLGFINFVIEPFFGPMAELILEVHEAMTALAKTRAFWEEMDRQQTTYDDIFPKQSRLEDERVKQVTPMDEYDNVSSNSEESSD